SGADCGTRGVDEASAGSRRGCHGHGRDRSGCGAGSAARSASAVAAGYYLPRRLLALSFRCTNPERCLQAGADKPLATRTVGRPNTAGAAGAEPKWEQAVRLTRHRTGSRCSVRVLEGVPRVVNVRTGPAADRAGRKSRVVDPFRAAACDE